MRRCPRKISYIREQKKQGIRANERQLFVVFSLKELQTQHSLDNGDGGHFNNDLLMTPWRGQYNGFCGNSINHLCTTTPYLYIHACLLTSLVQHLSTLQTRLVSLIISGVHCCVLKTFPCGRNAIERSGKLLPHQKQQRSECFSSPRRVTVFVKYDKSEYGVLFATHCCAFSWGA